MRRQTIDVPPEWRRYPRPTSRPLTATAFEQAIARQMAEAERAIVEDSELDPSRQN